MIVHGTEVINNQEKITLSGNETSSIIILRDDVESNFTFVVPFTLSSKNVTYQFEWYDNNGVFINDSANDANYTISQDYAYTNLTIKKVNLDYGGTYNLSVYSIQKDNKYEFEKSKEFTLKVVRNDKKIPNEVKVIKGHNVTINYAINGIFSKPPLINCDFKTCDSFYEDHCENNTNFNDTSLIVNIEENANGDKYKSISVTFEPDDNGLCTCEVFESLTQGKDMIELQTIVKLYESQIIDDIFIDGSKQVAEGKTFKITCQLSRHYSMGKFYLDWKDLKTSKSLSDLDFRERINYSNQTYSTYYVTKTVTIRNTTINDTGKLMCKAFSSSNHQLLTYSSFELDVRKGIKPYVSTELKNGKNGKKKLERGRYLRLLCEAQGFPDPKIQWYKDNKKIDTNDDNSFNITTTNYEDTGYYKCVATNSEGEDEKTFYVEIFNPRKLC